MSLNFNQMANIVTVAVVAPQAGIFKVGSAGLNVKNIQSIQSRTADSVSAGISEIVYSYGATNGNYTRTVKVYSSTAAATIITATNA